MEYVPAGCWVEVCLDDGRLLDIRPDGDHTLGMIEVMIDEGLYDEDFAENWCHGFEELKTYAQHFRLEVAETISALAQVLEEKNTVRLMPRK